MQVQYLRIILLINNFNAGILCFLSAHNRGGIAAVTYALGGLLLGSLVMNALVLIYATILIQPPAGSGYIRLPDANRYARIQPGVWTFLLLALLDLSFGIVFLVLSIISFVGAWSSTTTLASTGALVAAVVHQFFFVAAFYSHYFKHYRLKLVMIDVSEEGADYDIDVAEDTRPRTKEQTIPGRQTSGPTVERSITGPYQGSPSTRPSQGANLRTDSPIKLIEPTETDALVEDHD